MVIKQSRPGKAEPCLTSGGEAGVEAHTSSKEAEADGNWYFSDPAGGF